MTAVSSDSVAQSAAEAFRAALASTIGMDFPESKLPLLGRVLADRVSATGAPNEQAYLRRLAAAPDELSQLASMLTVTETYFLRDTAQFRTVESFLLEHKPTAAQPVRLLSAACSTGAEPYSLAIAALQAIGPAARSALAISAFDLNPDVLEHARAGRYSEWALRETTTEIRDQYFRHVGREYLVNEDVRSMVRFEQRNLLDPDPSFWHADAFDLVFCRNVLMYFTLEAARRSLARITHALVPGGLLFLGHAENLRGLSDDYHLKHTHETFYYERRNALGANRATPSTRVHRRAQRSSAPAEPPAAPVDGDMWLTAIERSSKRIEELARAGDRPEAAAAAAPSCPDTSHDLEPALLLMQQERFQDALALLATAPEEHADDADTLLLRSVLLISHGDFESAEQTCAGLLERDDCDGEAHYVMALCREHAGDIDGALEHDRIASYLDSDFAMPHLHRGLLARRLGDGAASQRELRLASDLLAREQLARILLFGGGFGREALIGLCNAELEHALEAR